MAKEGTAEKVVQEIRRKTRRRFSAEEKIRIVLSRLEALRGDRAGQHSIRINLQWRICSVDHATSLSVYVYR